MSETPGAPEETALFLLNDLPSGTHDVVVAFNARPNRAFTAQCTVHHADGVSTAPVDQRGPAKMQSIGRFGFRLQQPDAAVVVASVADSAVMVGAIKLASPLSRRPCR